MIKVTGRPDAVAADRRRAKVFDRREPRLDLVEPDRRPEQDIA